MEDDSKKTVWFTDKKERPLDIRITLDVKAHDSYNSMPIFKRDIYGDINALVTTATPISEVKDIIKGKIVSVFKDFKICMDEFEGKSEGEDGF